MRSTILKLPAVGLAVVTLAACGGSDNAIEDSDQDLSASQFSQQLMPAATETVYLNLETGELVDETDEWHISANRLSLKLNSGESGSGNVGGALAVAQDEHYPGGEPNANTIPNLTPNSEQEHLLGILEEPESWQEDAFVSAFGGPDTWSTYTDDRTAAENPSGPAAGEVNEKPDVGYLVRSAEGDSYARMRVADFYFPTRAGLGISDFTLEFDVQAQGQDSFSETAITFKPPVDYDGGDACFDFDSDAVVDCVTSDSWDVQVGFSGRSWYLKTNSGVSGDGNGGASDVMTWAELDEEVSDPGVPQIYNTDATGGVFADHTWYEYGLANGHRIWPNFRTFLIKADVNDDESTVWTLQVIGYYDDSGTSGKPTLRWLPVELQQAPE
ncbi:HmuY family protein [Marinobacter halotolerans]|uniref:HmuY family protein n=1 Tax=Marinobacter halotolerans TaxID=1569211 RepID=UPI0012451292|nr:HmuY family protein [Marinobacter halotolerans]